MSNTTYATLFIVFYNVFTSMIFLLNKHSFISLNETWMGLMLNLLFIWNILLLFIVIKKIKKAK